MTRPVADILAEHEVAYGDEHDPACPLCGVDAQQGMTRDRLQTLIRGQIDPHSIVISFTDEGGFGVVAYVRDDDYEPFVVHRWATKDTAGQERPFMLYSGVYEDNAQRWMLVYMGRANLAVTID